MSKTRRNVTNGHTNGNRINGLFHTEEEKSTNGPTKELKIPLHGKTKNQKNVIKTIGDNIITFVHGCAGTGKAQPLDSIVYTPDGPKRMGEIQVGDLVSTENGNITNVMGVFPQGKKEIYRITFNDRCSVEASEDHLWKVHHRFNDGKIEIVTTKHMMERGVKHKRKGFRYWIEPAGVTYFNYQDVPLDPYSMGALLGDGCFRGKVSICSDDQEIVDYFSNTVDSNLTLRHTKDNGFEYDITRKPNLRGGINTQNRYIKEIRKLGLFNHMAGDKFIPEIYLYNSEDIRIALLQGLMDTDGCIHEGDVSFCTTSKQLSLDFQILVQSLGGSCTITKRKIHYKYKDPNKVGFAYYCYPKLPDNSILFRLTRKINGVKERFFRILVKRTIINIEKIGEKDCQCISVEDPSHLYVTNHFVLTHNTHMAVGMAATALSQEKVERIIVTRPVVPCNEEDLGFLPGDFNEKVAPYLRPVFDQFADFFTQEQMKHFRQGDVPIIEIAPLAYIKGRTFKNAFIILDEAQDATYKQLKMFLTRMGENSKIVITGDVTQMDRGFDHKECPMEEFMKKLDGVCGIGFARLDPSDIIRHPLIGQLLERI